MDLTTASLSASLRSLSLSLHGNPELSYHEVHAHAECAQMLEDNGFDVQRSAYGLDTAFVADWILPTASHHKNQEMTTTTTSSSSSSASASAMITVAFLCEYDALPEIGHACGHNLIAITGIGAALSLKTHLQHLPSNTLPPHSIRIRVLGTPAEETTGGKITMIERGALEGVDIAMMVHPGNANITWAKYLALASMTVEYHGKAAHASAAPWEGVNALDALVSAYSSVSMLRQQIHPTSRIHGIIKKGGDAPNIIPAHTVGEFYIRAEKSETLDHLNQQLDGIFKGAASATGCQVKIQRDPVFKDVVINKTLATTFEKYARKYGCMFPSVEIQTSRSYGSTDMGNVTHVVPGIHPVFDIGSGDDCDIHTVGFERAAKSVQAHESALRAATCLAETAAEYLLNTEMRSRVLADFQHQLS